MKIILNYRKPDPYVEIDGVRKPMSDYPDLKVTRDREEIPGLREVNCITGLVTRSVASASLTVDKEEPFGNFCIVGVLPHDICQTGADPRFTVGPDGYKRVEAKPAPRPKPPPAVKPPPVKPPEPVATAPVPEPQDVKPPPKPRAKKPPVAEEPGMFEAELENFDFAGL